MTRTGLSSRHALFLAIMALAVGVMCVTIRVIAENQEARIIMATIWAIIGVWWLIQAVRSRQQADGAGLGMKDKGGER